MPRFRPAPPRVAAAVGALALCAAGAAAQAPRPLPDSGAVLRLDAPGLALSGRPVTLDAPWGDPLVVVDPAGLGRTSVPLARVARADVRVRGRPGGAARGARVGLIAGGLPSLALIAVALQADRNCGGGDYCYLPVTPVAVAAGALVTGLATGVGALVGHARGGARWVPVWPPARTALRATPDAAPELTPVVTGRAVGLALRARF